MAAIEGYQSVGNRGTFFRSCCDCIVTLVLRIASTVKEALKSLVRFIFCIKQKEPDSIYPPGRLARRGRVRPRPIIEPPQRPVEAQHDLAMLQLRADRIAMEAVRRDLAVPLPRIMEIEALEDAPVDLEALRKALREGREALITKRMTPRDWIALIDEFPREKTRIGEWAARWAEERFIRIDPNHPYFEIFQKAFEYRDQINGGLDSSDNYQDYSANRTYSGWNLFLYIIHSLMGFQEFSREENRELLRKLDTHQPDFENPAYQYARALSKILTYPTRTDFGTRMDIHDKLQIGIGAPMEAFQAAKADGKILEYFQKAFGFANCFDARISNFQQFQFSITHPHVEDFSPNMTGKDTLDHQLLEHWRVFTNKQIFKMTKEKGLDYTRVKEEIDWGKNNDNTRLFFGQYNTLDQFAQYLEENGQPIREKIAQLPDQPVHIIPQQTDWGWRLPKGVKKVPIDLIPQDQRHVGVILAVRDPSLYEATVLRIQGQIARVEFSERETLQPEMQCQHPWRGTEKRKEIAFGLLPKNRRYVGALVGVKDPNLYQVKIFEVGEHHAVIDFRGEPVPKARWEKLLADNGIT